MSRLARAAELVGMAAFATMFGAFLVQVASRYVFNRPVAWTEEVALVAYVWAVFWACALVVPRHEHVAFDLVYQAAPERVRRFLALGGALLLGGLFLAALPGVWDYVTFMKRERTPVLGLRFDLIFSSFALFVAVCGAAAAWRAARLLGRGWRRAL